MSKDMRAQIGGEGNIKPLPLLLSTPSPDTICKSNKKIHSKGSSISLSKMNFSLRKNPPQTQLHLPIQLDFPLSQTSGLGSPGLPGRTPRGATRRLERATRPPRSSNRRAASNSNWQGGSAPEPQPAMGNVMDAVADQSAKTEACSGAICQEAKSHLLTTHIAGVVQLN